MAITGTNKGDKFFRLTLIEPAGKTKGGMKKWLCLCDCGNQTVGILADIKRGHKQSCGCLLEETRGKHIKTHGEGHIRTKEYRIWKNIKTRCKNKNNPNYYRYGGRGITICLEWDQSYEKFLEDMGRCPEGLSLDRVNNDLGYYKENCRWATWNEQAKNRRSTRLITYNGETLCILEWARKLRINSTTLYSRLNNGWTIEETLLLPIGGRKKSEKIKSITVPNGSEWKVILGESVYIGPHDYLQFRRSIKNNWNYIGSVIHIEKNGMIIVFLEQNPLEFKLF